MTTRKRPQEEEGEACFAAYPEVPQADVADQDPAHPEDEGGAVAGDPEMQVNITFLCRFFFLSLFLCYVLLTVI